MLKITTKSGAVYLDDEKGRVQRLSGPYSPGINYDIRPDAEWVTLASGPVWRVGVSAYMTFGDGSYRITTPIESIEEVDE